MGLYNLQNICKILIPFFTLASSIDIHNLKSSFDPKHLWNHRISLSMGRKKKKKKKRSELGYFFLDPRKFARFLIFLSSKERREIIREHKIRNIFAIFSSITYIYIYICLSSHGEEYFFSNVSFSPFFAVFCSLLRPQETLLFAWHGVSKEPHPRQACPRILRRCLPPFLRSNQAAWNRVIARTSAQLCFSSPWQVAPSALGSSNEGSKLVLINLVTPKELEIRLFGLERISRIFMNDKIKIESNNDLELLTNK